MKSQQLQVKPRRELLCAKTHTHHTHTQSRSVFYELAAINIIFQLKYFVLKIAKLQAQRTPINLKGEERNVDTFLI